MLQEKGGKLAEFEGKLNTLEGNHAKLVAKSKASKDSISAEERRKRQLEKNLRDVSIGIGGLFC